MTPTTCTTSVSSAFVLWARHLGDTFWLYVVWGPTGPAAELVRVQDPGHRMEHVARQGDSLGHVELSAEGAMGALGAH